MNLRAVHLLGLVLPGLVAGCATSSIGKRPEVPDGDKCLALFAKVDQEIDAAGVRDAGYARVPGFPYLRSDRFSASFAEQVRGIEDLDTFWEWVGYLRANEDEAREVELRNLYPTQQQATSLLLDLRGCGAWLRSWELDDPAFRQNLFDSVRPPDEYSGLSRTLGLYPLAKPFLKRGVADYQAKVLGDYAKPLEAPAAPIELVRWTVKRSDEFADTTLDLKTKPRDQLGRIGMLGSEVVQLAQFYAPALWIETAGSFDLPGAPVLGVDKPTVDTARPVVYFQPGLTRFGGRNLLQLSYFVWFSERTPQKPGDQEAGVLDGLIWRVTLDDDGRVLLHDTIHACGCYHFGFPAQPMTRKPDDAGEDQMLLPQAGLAPERVAVRLQSGTHAVRRVVRVDQASAPREASYELRPYEDLLTLPAPGGSGTRSLFGPDGLIAGTERSERLWLWPSGVRSPGTMRQWGRHATSFVDNTHFDDPFLLERLFETPDSLPPITTVSEPPSAATP